MSKDTSKLIAVHEKPLNSNGRLLEKAGCLLESNLNTPAEVLYSPPVTNNHPFYSCDLELGLRDRRRVGA